MNHKLSILFATLAGICFVGGLTILKTKGLFVWTDQKESYRCWIVLWLLRKTSYGGRDSSKRFLIIWGGLAFTVMTLKHDENDKESNDEQKFIE